MQSRFPRIDRRLGLLVALGLAALFSPFASSLPDGLDRVAADLGFEQRAHPEPLGQRLPTARLFDEYQLRGVPQPLATPLAGVIGTLLCFGLGRTLGGPRRR
jgi:cobalt/nickel transport protein